MAMQSIASRLLTRRSSSELSTTRSEGNIRAAAASKSLCEPPNSLKQTVSNCEKASDGLRHAARSSPCYFHWRFDDAVDIDKVLEEIASDESMSHSRLVQTATGVREVSKQLQRRPIKRAVRTVMIVTKARDNNLVTLTRELAEWLMQTPRYGSVLGVTVYVDDKLRNSKRFDASGLIAQEPRFERMLQYWTPDLCWSQPDKFDLVLTLGGDGTVLFTSWLFQRVVPPVLSFSLGSLGFLTPFGFSQHREHLNCVMGGLNEIDGTNQSGTPIRLSPISSNDIVADAGMSVNLRMRFTCTVYRASSVKGSQSAEETSQFEVLNELVIDRGPSPYVSNLELFGDESLLTVIQADGVIFSTPTGSTAYSLSAGGSLVHPDIPAILLTPICPHTLSFRPMLLNDTMALRIAVPRNSRATAYCSFDGKGRIELRQGDFVTIAASRYPFPTVVGGRTEWIDSVSRTLRWNTREAQQKGWGSSKSRPDRMTSLGSVDRPGSIHGLPTPGNMSMDSPADEEVDEEETVEEYDIDIDDLDAPVDSRDSGYDGGDTGSTVSIGNGVHGAASITPNLSPTRRNASHVNL